MAKKSGGKKNRFNAKEDRQIEHIVESEQKRGLSKDEAEHRAYGRVQNQRQGKKAGGKKGRSKKKS
jgi:hypothetical protein